MPLDALYKCWHIGGRLSAEYYPADLITEILGNGQSSRLFRLLVKEQQLFSGIHAYQYGSTDPGLLVIEGKVREGVSLETANAAVEDVVAQFAAEEVTNAELLKAKNKIEAMISFEDMALLSRANNLAFYELLGDAALINSEWDKYDAVTATTMRVAAAEIFRTENSNTLFYRKAAK